MGGWISVRNWRKFQHYQDRNPPWIKNYTELLHDEDYISLSSHRRAILHGIWLVYASTNARVRLDPKSLSRRLHIRVTSTDLAVLLETGFLDEVDDPEPRASGWASRYVSDETRARVLDRFGHKCAICKETTNLEIDHIVPISKGGTSEEDNLRVLCRPCNRRLHNSGSVAHRSSTGLASVTSETETEGETKTEDPSPNPDRELGSANGRLHAVDDPEQIPIGLPNPERLVRPL